MIVLGRMRTGAYFDSVTLMTVSQRILSMPGVADAAAILGTEANREILAAAGLLLPEFSAAKDGDLLIVVRAETEPMAAEALEAAFTELDSGRSSAAVDTDRSPRSLGGALEVMPGADLALISVPGRYAGREAARALARGLHVMLFSDNVPVATELSLKQVARDSGLIVMGPDCGTAIIGGVPLGFANVVRAGPIGIVGASGTGTQEISSLISNHGSGISHVIGTGGRDVRDEVGGISFLAALAALTADPGTEVIVLVSKPPDRSVLNRIAEAVAAIDKPVVAVFLGAEPGDPKLPSPRWHQARTLAEAAALAVALAGREDPGAVEARLRGEVDEIRLRARQEACRRTAGQKYVRGLMSGGTFAAETQILLLAFLENLHSNVPVTGAARLADASQSVQHTVVDLGADEFTVGRPHPMIDYSLRKQRILTEAVDPRTAVILLDVVLGHGSHPDPGAELFEVVREASATVCVVGSVTGTDQDPQNRSQVVETLERAGAVIMPSNAAATLLVGYLIQELGER